MLADTNASFPIVKVIIKNKITFLSELRVVQGSSIQEGLNIFFMKTIQNRPSQKEKREVSRKEGKKGNKAIKAFEKEK